jgi:methionine aminopeptidase
MASHSDEEIDEEEDTEISNPDVLQKYKDAGDIANRIF